MVKKGDIKLLTVPMYGDNLLEDELIVIARMQTEFTL